MKNHLKRHTNVKAFLLLIGGAIMLTPASQVWALSPTAIPGLICQANDQAALKPGELIRTTHGIKNNGSKTISVYCPIDTNTNKKTLKVTLTYTSDELIRAMPNSDVGRYSTLTCWAGYGSKPVYKKFVSSGADTNSVSLATRKFGNHPVTIKCNLKPGEQIRGILSQ
jgi:hypothetical protein